MGLRSETTNRRARMSPRQWQASLWVGCSEQQKQQTCAGAKGAPELRRQRVRRRGDFWLAPNELGRIDEQSHRALISRRAWRASWRCLGSVLAALVPVVGVRGGAEVVNQAGAPHTAWRGLGQRPNPPGESVSPALVLAFLFRPR